MRKAAKYCTFNRVNDAALVKTRANEYEYVCLRTVMGGEGGQLHVRVTCITTFTWYSGFECFTSSPFQKRKRPKIALGIVSLFLLTLFRQLLRTFYLRNLQPELFSRAFERIFNVRFVLPSQHRICTPWSKPVINDFCKVCSLRELK